MPADKKIRQWADIKEMSPNSYKSRNKDTAKAEVEKWAKVSIGLIHSLPASLRIYEIKQGNLTTENTMLERVSAAPAPLEQWLRILDTIHSFNHPNFCAYF